MKCISVGNDYSFIFVISFFLLFWGDFFNLSKKIIIRKVELHFWRLSFLTTGTIYQWAVTTTPCEMLLEFLLFKDSEEFYTQKYEKRDCLVNLCCFCIGDQKSY